MQQHPSEAPPVARVSLCDKCTDIHLTIGFVSLRLSLEAFGQLAKVIQGAVIDLKTGEPTTIQQGIGSHWLLQKMSSN